MDNNGDIMDSAEVKDGAFRFNGSVSIPQRCSIFFNFSPNMFNLFLDNESFTVKGQLIPFSVTSSGGRLDSIYSKFSSARLLPASASFQIDNILSDPSWNKPGGNTAIKEKLRSLVTFMDSVQWTRDTAFIAKEIHSYLAPTLIADLFWRKKDLGLMSSYYELLDDTLKNTPGGRFLLKKIVALRDVPKAGDSIPDFSIVNTENVKTTITRRTHQNYFLIDFWASWCKPCIEEFPFLKQADSIYRHKGLDIVSISLDDDRTDWLKAVKKYGLPWKQYREDKNDTGRLSKRLKVHAIPASFLVDRNMRIIAVNLRGPDLIARLNKLFPKEGQH